MVIDGQEVHEITWQPLDVITQPKRVQLRSLGVAFQNTGDSTVKLGNIWTIYPRGSFQLAPSKDTNILVIDVKVSFEGGTTNRLEISEMTTNHPELANYIEQNRT